MFVAGYAHSLRGRARVAPVVARSDDEVDGVAAAAEATPDALEDFAALLLLLGGAAVVVVLLAGAFVAGAPPLLVAGGLLDVKLLDGEAGGLERALELTEGVAHQAGGIVGGGLDRSDHHAVAELD